ncbi:MAG: RsmB/NOP family class I SAM-dependent RNA methyltransferase [Spirochaetia bacterium]
MSKGTKKGENAFHAFYEALYPDRWKNILSAFQENKEYEEVTDLLRIPYYLDKASYMTASQLFPEAGENVLDMCAAPGGKALVLFTKMRGRGRLTVNDRSFDRLKRTQRVFKEHLPDEHDMDIRFTNKDATKWFRYESNVYDKVLADVPCSSEVHVLGSKKHLGKWSPSRTKHLAIQAFAILASALEAVKNSGIILYSTCTLSPLENDRVIEKLDKKRKGQYKILPISADIGEPTEYGRIILPDKHPGMGPMYLSKIQKIRDYGVTK